MTDKRNNLHWQDDKCKQCPELVDSRTQIVVATKCRHGGLLAIGEAPGADEDKQGVGFVGKAGLTLEEMLSANGISSSSYGRANICRCRPPKNREPNSQEIASCLPFLASLIEEARPKVILAVGRTATTQLCGSGTLHCKIQIRQASGNWKANVDQHLAHEAIREALSNVAYVVPMPHTSPLTLNRNDPSGESWSAVAKRQVAIAVQLLNK